MKTWKNEKIKKWKNKKLNDPIFSSKNNKTKNIEDIKDIKDIANMKLRTKEKNVDEIMHKLINLLRIQVMHKSSLVLHYHRYTLVPTS